MEFTGARWCYPVPLFHPCAGPDPPGGQLGWSRGGSEAPGATKPAATSMRNGTSTTREYQRHHAQRYADGNSAAGQQAALPTTPSTGFPSSSCRAAGRSPLGRRRRRAAPVRDRIPGRFGLDPVRDIQVLCPMNRGGAGARALNIELQAALNPAGEEQVERFGWTFAPGDKVMQIENDYDKDVYNGDIGTVEGVDAGEGELTAGFDGRRVTYGFGELDRLVLAYAATIHKSQGSEYPAVVDPGADAALPARGRSLFAEPTCSGSLAMSD